MPTCDKTVESIKSSLILLWRISLHNPFFSKESLFNSHIMDNLEGAGDAAHLVEKSDQDGSQLELQSLGEIERQYAEYSATRDAQLENLRKTVAVSLNMS